MTTFQMDGPLHPPFARTWKAAHFAPAETLLWDAAGFTPASAGLVPVFFDVDDAFAWREVLCELGHLDAAPAIFAVTLRRRGFTPAQVRSDRGKGL